MSIATRLFALAWLIAGCAGLETDHGIAKQRAEAYVAAHPKLGPNTASAILSSSIRDGMTMSQVIAAWGRPAVVRKFRDSAVQYWFFGCDWPHFCHPPERRSGELDEVYRSRALFENGLVVGWGN